MTRKNIAVISGFSGTNDAMIKSFYNVFGEEYNFKKFVYPDEFDQNYNEFDLVICSSNYILEAIKEKSIDTPTVLADRNLDMKSISKLLSLKSNTVIYVAGSSKQGALEVIDILNDIGISHLTLIPYYEQFVVEPNDIILSIMPCPTNYLNHKRLIKVEFADLNIYTFLAIFVKLKMSFDKLNKVIKKYYNDELLTNKHIGMIYKNLQGVLEITRDGIVCIDNNGMIVFCNKSFSELIEINYFDLISKSCSEIEFEQSLLNIIYKKDEISYEVINYKNKKLIITKQYLPNDKNYFVINIQNATHIQEIETTVRKKLLHNGFFVKYTIEDIIGESQTIKNKIIEAKKIAKSNFAVLIQGNNGTGKEMFAHAIHNQSNRSKNPFVAINLASLSDSLIESELFGYEEGAFTGALKGGKQGLFEIAHNGTIFIDEIGDISPNIQKRLLRVLQEKEIMRLGGNKIIPINVRVISATNRDLFKLVEDGIFRKDLYYRLKVLYINLPDLKDRIDDLPLFVHKFFNELNSTKYIDYETIQELKKYSWPGNVRELQNLVYYLNTICDNDEIKLCDIPEEYKVKNSSSNYQSSKFDDILALYDKKTIFDFKIILDKLNIYKDTNIGKTMLYKLINNKEYSLSIEQIRIRLVKLSCHKLILIGKTRQGSKITQLGIEFLNYLNNLN